MTRSAPAGGALVVAGIILLVAAGVAGAPLFTTDIPSEAIHTVESPGSVTVEPGIYEVWFQIDADRPDPELVEKTMEELRLSMTDGEATVFAPRPFRSGNSFGAHVSFGIFEVEATTSLDVSTTRRATFHLTEPMDSGEPIGRAFRFGLPGALLIGFGIAVLVRSRSTGADRAPRLFG